MRDLNNLNREHDEQLPKKFYKESVENTHFEFSSDRKEVEVYVGGYFLCSVLIKDISDECKHELFE